MYFLISDKPEFCQVKSRRNPIPEPHFLFQNALKLLPPARWNFEIFQEEDPPTRERRGGGSMGPELAPPQPNNPRTATGSKPRVTTYDRAPLTR